MMTLPNKLTLFRGLLGLLTFVCLWTLQPRFYALAFLLYVAATVTDWIDGYIARKTGATSAFGAMADPIADKILVLGALIACTRIAWLDIPVWAVFLIIVRELVVGGLRALAGAQGKLLAAERWGKWKMGIQSGAVIAILLLLVLQDWLAIALPEPLPRVPAWLTLLACLVTVASGAAYLRQNRRLMETSWSAPSEP